MNTYRITRKWFELSAVDRRIKPVHTALFFYIIDLNNRLAWKKEFGLPSNPACETLNITYNTFKKAFDFLVCDIPAIRLVEKSVNQYTANIISLDVLYQFLHIQDESTCDANEEQTQKQSESNSDIDKPIKQLNPIKTYKQLLLSEIEISDLTPEQKYHYDIALSFQELFKANLDEAGLPHTNVNKATGKWIDTIRLMIKNDKYTIEQIRSVWSFLKTDLFWKKNILSINTLRKQFDKLILAQQHGIDSAKPKQKQPACSDEDLADVFARAYEKEQLKKEQGII